MASVFPFLVFYFPTGHYKYRRELVLLTEGKRPWPTFRFDDFGEQILTGGGLYFEALRGRPFGCKVVCFLLVPW